MAAAALALQLQEAVAAGPPLRWMLPRGAAGGGGLAVLCCPA